MEVSSSLYVAVVYGTFLSLLLGYGCLGCLEEERVGLLKLKASMNHPNGTALSSWGGEVADCCRWENVTCDNRTNRVIKLSLVYIRHKEIREGDWWRILPMGEWSLNASLLLPFQQLQILDLSDNYLTGFQGILRLKKLRVLDLRHNRLTTIPILSALPSLKDLDLEDNNINSSQLQGLKYSSRLEVLNLGSNSLMGSIPPIIGNWSCLKSLSLSYNNLNGSLSMEGLCKLSNLQELDISGNGIERNFPLCLNNLTSLRALDLSNNNFKGTMPSSLFPSLKLLEYISLSYNDFEGSFYFTSLFNHSKLEVFELISGNKNLKVETEDSTCPLPLFQLRIFHLSHCILNGASGIIPSFLSSQYELRMVDLSHNGIIGDIPTWLLVNNSKLEGFSLSGNQLRGPLALEPNSKYAYMKVFDISFNLIQGEIPPDIGYVLPKLTVLNMSRNALHGNFPPSMGNMSSLELLDLSNNNFSGLLPQHLVMGCIWLRTLILSNNNFSGNFPAKSNLTSLLCLFLDNNRFLGEISRGLLKSSSLELLDIGNNSFSGQIPDWIGNFPNLVSLVLSRNSLEGVMPTSFCKLGTLKHLDLSSNKIGLSIPPCLNLSNMKFLHLQSNKLIGPIPNVLSRALSLFILDLTDNKFSGAIPAWISSLSSLRVLLLGGNEFHDSIPFDLCKLKSIRIMDLSHNNLFGSIPSCLNNLTFRSKQAEDEIFATTESIMSAWYPSFQTYSYKSQINVGPVLQIQSNPFTEGEKVEFTTKRRFETYSGSILRFMSGMDLSWNNLTGLIPPELGDLSEIHSINLSGNHLTGSIPETFSNLKEIESLDLSHNMLIGQIPPQMIELTKLGTFTVAHNNLSGKLPERTAQFGTFDESSYEGNPLLCGLPLNRNCTPTRAPPATPPALDNAEKESWETLFFWSFGGSFGVAFLGMVAFLYLNSYYQELLFYFVGEYAPFLWLKG